MNILDTGKKMRIDLIKNCFGYAGCNVQESLYDIRMEYGARSAEKLLPIISKSITPQDVFEITGVALTSNQVREQVVCITNSITRYACDGIINLSADQLRAMPNDEVHKLSSRFIPELPIEQLYYVFQQQSVHLPKVKIPAISTEQVSDFRPQILYIASEQVPAVYPAQMPSLSPEQLPDVGRPSQVPSIAPEQVPSASPGQLPAASPAQVSAVNVSEISFLSPQQISDLSDSQIPNIDSSMPPELPFFSALSDKQDVNGPPGLLLIPQQMPAASTDQLLGLSTSHSPLLPSGSISRHANVSKAVNKSGEHDAPKDLAETRHDCLAYIDQTPTSDSENTVVGEVQH
jgi:hypothetical protein